MAQPLSAEAQGSNGNTEQSLLLILDTIPALVSTWTPSGELEYVNRRFLEFVGMPGDNLVKLHSTMHADDRERAATTWTRSVETGEPFDIRYRVRRADGVYRWLHTRGEPLRDANGRIVRWYKLTTDVDDQKKAEEALQTSQAELAHVTRVTSMGELTASIAHELNQPLAAVVTHGQACLRWLNRPAPDLAEARGAVERMIQDGIRGGEVIARIRALMKKEPPARVLLDLDEAVRETLAIAPLQTAGTVLRLELAGDLPRVLADRIQLQQVLLNLIGNAADAMRFVGDRTRELVIRTAVLEPRTVSLAVEDTGIGVEPDQWDRLFEPFHTTKPDGLGMGLTISRSIIESHGGRLWAERNAGPGMTFRFSLPVAEGGAE